MQPGMVKSSPPMAAVMQHEPLGLHLVLERAEALFGPRPVHHRSADGPVVSTFAEQLQQARRVAAGLRELGLRPGDRVATLAWNTAEHLTAYLALPAAGLVMHTVNVRMGAEEVAFTLVDAGDTCVLVDPDLVDLWRTVRVPDCVRHVVVLGDADLEQAPGGPAVHTLQALDSTAALPVWFRPDDDRAPSGVCYTSGTTGHPKGVVYSHRSTYLHALTLCWVDTFAIGHHDTVLPVVPMFHANAWNLVYAALLAGAGLALPGRHTDAVPLAETIVHSSATFSAAVPTVWAAMVDAVRAGRVPAGTLVSLDRVVVGGSAPPDSLLRGLADLGITPVHGWGMTECSPVGLVARPPAAAEPDEITAALRTQGRPMPGLAVRVLDDDGAPQAWNGDSAGELTISGPYVAGNYHGADPKQSGDELFSRDPDGRCWFRTGDVATVDERGYVLLVDRTKDLIKSGGEWISSVDLENRLADHPQVAEAAVVAVPHERWGERPLAVVVGPVMGTATGQLEDNLRSYLAAQVPSWQIPDAFWFVDELPKTSVGKLDKKRLRAQVAQRPSARSAFGQQATSPPRSSMEGADQ